MELIAFIIVGYMQVGPDSCQVDYLRYSEVHSVVIPCSENQTSLGRAIYMIPTTNYSKL